ncbi:MAG: tetratricopeptide repeat protein [Saprospiraceae bacterium]|nr:tetratricopeptide repeat protein [Saprospiraceae bacterium]
MKQSTDGYNFSDYIVIYVFLFFLVSPKTSWGQDSLSFEHLYKRTSDVTTQISLDNALREADSLYEISQKPLFQIRSLILIARIYQQKEDLDKAIEYAQKAEKMAEKYGEFAWQARSNGMIAGQYRMMELYNQAKKYTAKAMQIIPKIKNHEMANSTAGLMQQEFAFTNMDQDNWQQAIIHLNAAEKYFNRLKEKKYFLINNDRLLGTNYFYLKNYDLALSYYKRALDNSKNNPVNYITGMIHKGMAETYLEMGKLSMAKQHLDEAEKIADQSQYLQIKNSIYDLSTRYYALVKDSNILFEARNKKDSINEQLLDKRADLLDKNYAELNNKDIKAENESKLKNKTIFTLLAILVIVIVSFLFYSNKKRKKELDRFKEVMEQLNALKTEVPLNKGLEAIESINSQRNTSLDESSLKNDENLAFHRIMSEKTEQKLLDDLTNFENSNLYLDKNISLSSLSTEFETNNKYLSYVIKVHKNTDFSTYVNKLRINYIIRMLKENPDWRKYKISFLAETTGFSSHSQFTSIFKTLKGLSPSAFIRYLDKEGE